MKPTREQKCRAIAEMLGWKVVDQVTHIQFQKEIPGYCAAAPHGYTAVAHLPDYYTSDSASNEIINFLKLSVVYYPLQGWLVAPSDSTAEGTWSADRLTAIAEYAYEHSRPSVNWLSNSFAASNSSRHCENCLELKKKLRQLYMEQP